MIFSKGLAILLFAVNVNVEVTSNGKKFNLSRKRVPFHKMKDQSNQKDVHLTTLRNLLEPARIYAASIGLYLNEVAFDTTNNLKRYIKIDTGDPNVNDEDQRLLEQAYLQENNLISQRKWTTLRNGLHWVKGISSINNIIAFKKQIDQTIQLTHNNYGVYVDPVAKITNVCKKFLEKNKVIRENTFVIKLSGDGTNITNSMLKLLNFTFTLINDEKTAKSCAGNYILGIFIWQLNST